MTNQKNLSTDKITVFVDHRENSIVNQYLEELGAKAVSKQLKVADYICSDRIGIEKKTVSDFLGSILNQRIFKQLEELKNSFEKPIFILEGNPDLLFNERDIHENVIRGVLFSIAVKHGIPIMWTANIRETAKMLFWIAKREQENSKGELQIRAKIKTSSVSKQQEFILAGLPLISNVTSKKLLKKFKTVKKVFSAKQDKLMKIEGIGKEKAKKIWELINKKYEEEDK